LNKPWFLYVLRCSDNTLYTGVTTDYKRRLHEHNNTARGAKYTRSRRPSKIEFAAHYEERSSAMRAEHAFKQMSRKQKEDFISKKIWIGDLVEAKERTGIGIVIDMIPEWRAEHAGCNHYRVKWVHYDTSYWLEDELLLISKK